MGKISEIFNFDNIGGKIKNLAKWSCWITILLIWIAAPIAFIVLVSDKWNDEFCWIPLVGAIIAPIFVWIGSWAMYAFGELVEKTCDNESNIRQIHEKSSESNKSKNNSSANKEQNDFEKKDKAKHEEQKKVKLRKSNQCECGEIFYGIYCPICGKKAINTRPVADPEEVSLQPTPSSSDDTNKKSVSRKCKCGERFYGEVCPNCGRTLKDL